MSVPEPTAAGRGLAAALDPASIAIIGASENPNKIGGRPLLYLRRFGFRGQVYPINPKRPETQGWPTYPSLAALPEAPELAIVALPGSAAIEAVDACAAAGVRVVVLMTSGFGESDPEAGKASEQAMTERARARGMRIVGPNSQGLANFGTGAIASFSTMFIEVEPADGPVGIVSQSGAMSVVPYGLLRQRGIGVRHSHATGNDGDVTAAELAVEVARDPAVRLLLLYFESIVDPWHLADLAAIARERELPVIALKAGRTGAGQAAARSHTGALANEDRLVEVFLREHGIMRARDTQELVAGAELYLSGAKPAGRRLVAISNSGATCVMAADAASMQELTLAPLAAPTREKLGKILPSFASTVNPVDITAALLTNSGLFSDILPVIAEDPAADLFFVGVPVAGTGYDVDAFARDTAAFARAVGKPLVVAAPQPPVAGRFAAYGLPVFADEFAAVDTLARFVRHHELMADARHRRSPVRRTSEPCPAGEARLLNEAESLALLAAAGLPVVPHQLCRTATEAVAAFELLGPRVAIKGCSAEVPHKSELGIVRLGIANATAVHEAFLTIQEIIVRAGKVFDGVIVATMASGRREMMIGGGVDPVFGPFILVGDGGAYVEALPDTQLLLPPFSVRAVMDALALLRIAPVLRGVRGEPPLDTDAFAAMAVAVGNFITHADGRISSLDLNPVIVGERRTGCIILDAVILEST